MLNIMLIYHTFPYIMQNSTGEKNTIILCFHKIVRELSRFVHLKNKLDSQLHMKWASNQTPEY